VIEEAMGHRVGTGVERAYRRTDVLEKRRELMTAGANYCAPNPLVGHPTLTGALPTDAVAMADGKV
jgi:hypothetical protein